MQIFVLQNLTDPPPHEWPGAVNTKLADCVTSHAFTIVDYMSAPAMDYFNTGISELGALMYHRPSTCLPCHSLDRWPPLLIRLWQFA